MQLRPIRVGLAPSANPLTRSVACATIITLPLSIPFALVGVDVFDVY